MRELVCWNPQYLSRILEWKKIGHSRVGMLWRMDGYSQYNFLIEINRMFSSNPRYEPVDRTRHTKSPFKTFIPRPWHKPDHQWTLEHALQQRVSNLSKAGKKINVFWSGGIDSTCVVTACLKYLDDLSQLRILYSPYSCYEHPHYLDFLKQFSGPELIDISGEYYLTDELDGIFITGDSGDELNASLDQSFFEQTNYDGLHKPWQDLFASKNNSDSFFEQCHDHFSLAGRPIQTVLHARWWFYATCKQRSILNLRLPWFLNYQNPVNAHDLLGFFDCDEYENYIYWNIESVINRAGYHTWKQHLKDFCFEFDQLSDWHQNKTKTHSKQMILYLNKKLSLNDQRWIGMLSNGTRLHTPSLPILTIKELDQAYGNNLNWIFNEPDQV